ncbi:hypothetical protein FOYG_09491 [Fusarium oxysporum NRRL 32931]|uniref:Uncharacterized protein n=1 Tax=Fusarium oxysporum NRRL 32931 TaxID=660029 RepID=W9I4I1_FUSOX|nr:hypothetical protein FOYG_09491 [Fusarium oxysporum NRRL 32931]
MEWKDGSGNASRLVRSSRICLHGSGGTGWRLCLPQQTGQEATAEVGCVWVTCAKASPKEPPKTTYLAETDSPLVAATLIRTRLDHARSWVRFTRTFDFFLRLPVPIWNFSQKAT